MSNLLQLYFGFKGRISRRVFWLYYVIPFVLGGWILSVIDHGSMPHLVNGILLFSIWPSMSIQIKRWHDIDKSGWWVLINLIPIIGSLAALIANGFYPGSEGDNMYGSPPNV